MVLKVFGILPSKFNNLKYALNEIWKKNLYSFHRVLALKINFMNENEKQLLRKLDSLRAPLLIFNSFAAQKMKSSIKVFFSKCDQIRRKLRIWSHLLKKSLILNPHFLCSVFNTSTAQLYLQFALYHFVWSDDIFQFSEDRSINFFN